jgi:hypothetical protein
MLVQVRDAMSYVILLCSVLFLAILLTALVCRSVRQKEAIRTIRELGGTVYFVDDDHTALGRLMRWVGEDYVGRIRWIELAASNVQDDDLICLQRLPSVWGIRLSYTSITDRGLRHLSRLRKTPRLDCIWLTDTQVSEEGIRQLRQALPHVDVIRAKPKPVDDQDRS